MSKENIIKLVKFAESKKSLRLKFAESKLLRLAKAGMIEPNGKVDDIQIEYDDSNLKVGMSVWARFKDDDEFKLPLPKGIYNLDTGKTISVEPEGVVASIHNTLTPEETFRKSLRKVGLK